MPLLGGGLVFPPLTVGVSVCPFVAFASGSRPVAWEVEDGHKRGGYVHPLDVVGNSCLWMDLVLRFGGGWQFFGERLGW